MNSPVDLNKTNNVPPLAVLDEPDDEPTHSASYLSSSSVLNSSGAKNISSRNNTPLSSARSRGTDLNKQTARLGLGVDNNTNNVTTPYYSSTNSLEVSSAGLDSENNRKISRNKSQSPSSRSSQSAGEMENQFSEHLAGSLEDLVSNFDEKITTCFKNYGEATSNVAPVQVRTQEEVMSESQIWWTLTGNFGNILPMDWSKTQARQLQLPALNLQPKKDHSDAENNLDLSDDEELAQALDLHSLIVSSSLTPHESSPPQTADQVIEEIDEIMQQSSVTGSSDMTMESADSLYSPLRTPPPLFAALGRDPELQAKYREAAALATDEKEDELRHMPYKKIVALQSELESLIQVYNESLVQELALKDELEYEKEVKNTFISLLLSIQNKRRQYVADRKRRAQATGPTPTGQNGMLPQYLTAVIPYQEGAGPPDNQSLQSLIKILRAVNDDNLNVPNMLTDYILNVLCPTTVVT